MPERLLVVDDDPGLLLAVSETLREAGYEVQTARRGAEALAHIAASLPDLVISDIRMPGMDGYTLVRNLRAAPRTRLLPIIFLTAKDETADRIAGHQSGADVYLTNAVKHFKWVPRGKRRIHQKPNRDEIVACRPWHDGELVAITPSIVVALGATAAGALLGPQVRVTRDRGQFQATSFAPLVTVTVHPSSILRSRTDEERRDARDRFVQDLRAVAERLRKIPHRSTSRRG